MRASRAFALLITTTSALCLAGVGSAAASQLDTLTYRITNLQSPHQVQIYYTSGVITASGGVLDVASGSVLAFSLPTNGMFLRAASGPVNAAVVHFITVDSAPIVGTAAIPAGTTVTLNDELSGKTITLKNGSFTIPTSAGLGARPPRGGTQTVRCHGGAHECEANVSIAGGASARKLVIQLSDTNLRLVSVTASPKSSQRSYTLSHGRYALGGSEYIVTLDALKSNPKGAHLVLRFAS